MSEYLNVTDELHNKYIRFSHEISKMPIPESDPVTKMCIILPESNISNSMIGGAIDNDGVGVIKFPIGDVEQAGLSPIGLDIDLVTADGVKIGFEPYSDDIILPEGVKPIGGDIIIPNQDQISIRVEMKNNVNRLLGNYLGFEESDYSINSGFELLAEDDSRKGLRFIMHVRSIGYQAIIDKIRDKNIQKDLTEEKIVILNQNELDGSSDDNVKKLGSHGLSSLGYALGISKIF